MNQQDIQTCEELGRKVLSEMAHLTNSCLYISAMLTAMINDHIQLEARLITGSLVIDNRTIFNHQPIASVLSSTTNVTSTWDGHAWVEVSDLILDFSIFQTIFSDSSLSDIQNTFVQKFGERKDYLIRKKHLLNSMHVIYTSQEQLTLEHEQVLINNIPNIGEFKNI